ncbi:hypothetical protein SteCoe_23849 [Stentor coeruleus]|uniref:Uncharacterized protein n=1 Tax=Stentor coeruleus TaxID=5963 RepID=A0A1R2BJF0_9CILI|nr:hypothetical protein SteCoe_23849 [Stentor coeruleus]
MEISARVVEPSDGLFRTIPGFEAAGLEIRYLNRLENNEEVLKFNERFVKACEDNDKPLLKSLLERKNIPILMWYIKKAFSQLAASKNYEFLNILIEAGLDLGHKIFQGTIPRLVIMLGGNEEDFEKIMIIMLKGGMQIDDSDSESNSTGLHLACLRLDVGVARILLKLKAHPTPINKMKLTPLNLVENDDCEEAREIKTLIENAGGESKWNSYMD